MKNNKRRRNLHNGIYRPQKYERFGIYSINEVVPFISKDTTKIKRVYDGNSIKLFSLRLRTFAKSSQCVSCGLQAEFFAAEKTSGSDRYHFNLYGYRQGNEILFTQDHIIPKSKGGLNTLKNLQTMCIVCNAEKGNGD